MDDCRAAIDFISFLINSGAKRLTAPRGYEIEMIKKSKCSPISGSLEDFPLKGNMISEMMQILKNIEDRK